MLGTYNYLYQEIFKTQEVLKNMGVKAMLFVRQWNNQPQTTCSSGQIGDVLRDFQLPGI